MMFTINVIGDNITGHVNGEHYGVSFTKERYDAMKALEEKAQSATSFDQLRDIVEEFRPMTKETYGAIVETKSPFIIQDPVRNQYFLRYNNAVSDVAIPQALVDRMITMVEKQLDITPIVKCWVRWLRNPLARSSQRDRAFVGYINTTYTDPKVVKELVDKKGFSEEKANEMATGYQTPITTEGLLCTYKVSREVTKKFVKGEKGAVEEVDRYDFEVDEFTGLKKMKTPEYVEDLVFEPAIMGKRGDEFTCKALNGGFDHKGHIIKVGCIHSLENWSQVSTNRTGGPGLHVGNLDYIRSYQSSGTATHNVFVDPMHIGGFSSAGGDGALVCKQYFVASDFKGVNRSVYHSAGYAAMTDAEFALMVEETVNKEKMAAEKAAELYEHRKNQASILK